MLGLRFDSRHHGQHCGAVEARRQRHVGQARLALGQGTGLVERDHLDALQGLEGLTLAEEHAHLGTTPGADHDRRWRGQTHGAGAGNDEDGDGVDQAKGQGRIRPEDQPDGEGQDGKRHDDGNEPHRHAVDQRLDRQLAALRGFDHADDLSQHRGLAHRRRPETERAGLVYCAAGHGAARCLLDRHGLARDHAFVDPACARRHLAVDRHPLARADLDDIARADFGDRHFDQAAIAKDTGGLGLKSDQPLDRL